MMGGDQGCDIAYTAGPFEVLVCILSYRWIKDVISSPRIHSTSKKGQLKGHCLLQATLGESYQKVFSGLDTLEGLMDARFIGCITWCIGFLLRSLALKSS